MPSLSEIRQELLLLDDFMEVLQVLQDYPPIEMDRLLILARRIHSREPALLRLLDKNESSLSPNSESSSWKSGLFSKMFRKHSSAAETTLSTMSPSGRPLSNDLGAPAHRRHLSLHDSYQNTQDVVCLRLALRFDDPDDLMHSDVHLQVVIQILPQKW